MNPSISARRPNWARAPCHFFASSGLVDAISVSSLYTVVASPGYFVARREWPPVVMFAVLGVVDAMVLVALLASDVPL